MFASKINIIAILVVLISVVLLVYVTDARSVRSGGMNSGSRAAARGGFSARGGSGFRRSSGGVRTGAGMTRVMNRGRSATSGRNGAGITRVMNRNRPATSGRTGVGMTKVMNRGNNANKGVSGSISFLVPKKNPIPAATPSKNNGRTKISGIVGIRGYLRNNQGNNRGNTQQPTKQISTKPVKPTAPVKPIKPTTQVVKSVTPSKPSAPLETPNGIGSVSAKYESAGKGVATISSGRKDPGGVSYGAHQLASKTGTMQAFLNSAEGRPFKAQYFNGLQPGTASFNQAYKQAAAADPKGFAAAQHGFITRTHYTPVANTAAQSGFNTNARPVQEALYSMSVQHGNAKAIVANASKNLKPNSSVTDQVKALYAARANYVNGIQKLPEKTRQSILNRYQSEVKDALSLQ